MSRRSSEAFTLMELLVTITILAVLLALLIPAVKRAVDSSKAAACLGNMRSFGNAVLMFVADNGGVLPHRPPGAAGPLPDFGNWVEPYLGRPSTDFRCPLVKGSEKEDSWGFRYGGNAALMTYYHSLRGIPAPSSRVVLAAENYWSYFDAPGHFNRTIWGNNSGGASGGDEGSAARPQFHGSKDERGLHMFFLDGHAQLVSPTKNDWSKKPTYGNKDNGGYFYHASQFSLMKSGSLVVQ